ncbi:MAG: battenin CLN3 protein [Chaenotheca gracillima]|nr:MAG: battenin CLN3 protein [Chaenotheca gracillima]
MSSLQLNARRLGQIPELVALILDFLFLETPTLLSCTRVNRLWAGGAVSSLWYRVGHIHASYEPPLPPQYRAPQVQHLAALADDAIRIQRYANCVRELTFSGFRRVSDSQYHSRFMGVRFPRLERFVLEQSEWNRPELLHQYLHPNLKQYNHFGSLGSNKSLKILANRCPSLEEISLDGNDDHIIEQGLIEFLQTATSLRRVAFYGRHSDSFAEKVLEPLAVHPHLSEMKGLDLPESWLEKIHSRNVEIFPSLSKLSASLTENGLRLLTDRTTGLTHLDAAIDGPNMEALELCTRLKSLKSLELVLSGAIHAENLLALASSCKLLESLRLADVAADMRPPPKIDDAFVNQFTTKLSKLETLVLHLRLPHLTTSSLLSFGKNCKRMQKLVIEGKFWLEDLPAQDTNGEVIFPELKTLALSFTGYDDHKIPSVSQALRRLEELAPKLVDFNYLTSNKDYRHLTAEWKRLQEN